MAGHQDASPWVPPSRDLADLETAAHECRGCELWEPATQVVFSSGARSASVMLVGEQPGDQEDRQGEPFIGPAGRVLDDALSAAAIDRGAVYLTNAVKHFRFEQRGKRRIHQKPELRHVNACHPWFDAELEAVQPRVVVALGATAARAVFGRTMKIGESRGRLLDLTQERSAIITSHPSAVLRLRGRGGYDEAFGELVNDLRLAAPYA
ncbi:MAG: phage polymerase-related protein [Nocardioides sp.]|jgi:uracil-DNA glycosylase family protein|uniref:UdgX family uracil-DNA binding protein n=1 Tax=Nocardioides sp. TaxID=35761 RepID=UPI002623BE60|nr:UdgX family uracil-DNA binding protein [Nocardioides sp.]MCW2834819.1 phage polymerase-related protein [Nocardioides sp.]